MPPRKSTAALTETPETVDVTYDLFDLPTAFHKAGLAGLILLIRWLKTKGHLGAEVKSDPHATSFSIQFTESTIIRILDEVYDASPQLAWVKSKWPGATPLKTEKRDEVDPKTQKSRSVTYFAYEVIQPCGSYLQKLYPPEQDQGKGWLKLWRDMLWAIPRGNPQSRQPFEQRAKNPEAPCKEGPAAWADLLKVKKLRRTGQFHTAPVAGSLWPGAQAVNAERISFEGRAEQNLLLHFWPLAVLVFVPDRFKIKQQSGALSVEYEPASYSLAIPEVADLRDFVTQYPVVLGELNAGLTAAEANRGFRPARAVIDLPDEGALAMMEHVAGLVGEDVQRIDRLRRVIHSVEFIHLAKEGNNIKTLAAGRIAPRADLLLKYREICPRSVKKRPYQNPLFRRALVRALLNDEPWFTPFGKLFTQYDAPVFVKSDASPRTLAWFWSDARRMLFKLEEAVKDSTSDGEEVLPEELLATTIHRFIRRYVEERLKDAGHDVVQLREALKTPAKAAEARRKLDEASELKSKLAERLFLEFRSRHDQAFVDHFGATFFRVGQYFGGKAGPRLFETVATALQTRRDEVKTLTLMSLSAVSWAPSKSSTPQESH